MSGLVAGTGLALTKAGAGTWTLSNGNTYTGGTAINAGTLASGADNALPTTTALTIGSGTSVGKFDLGTFNQTIAGLTVSPNSLSDNVITIGAGKTLTINGNVAIGNNTAANTTTYLSLTGGGSLVVTSAGGTFRLGLASGTTNFDYGTTDLSGLGAFTLNLGAAGTLRVGNTAGTSPAGGPYYTTLILAVNSTITAGTIGVGDATGQGANLSNLRLGSGVNILNTDTLRIGQAGTARSSGQMIFDTATGSLQVRGSAGDPSRAAALNIVNHTSGTGTLLTGLLDLAGHPADLLIGTLTLAKRAANSASGDTGTLTFDTGTLDVTTVIAGSRSSTTAGGTSTGTLNIGGGTVIVGTGGITLATSSVAGSTANGTVNLTGGNVTVNGNISKGASTGAGTATLNLDSATLDLTSHAIGGAAPALVTANFMSGTVRNIAQINNGANGITKTTAGTLVVEGVNGFTGTTTVDAGTLTVNGSQANANITVTDALVNGSGSLTYRLAGDNADRIRLVGAGAIDITALTLNVSKSGVQSTTEYVIIDDLTKVTGSAFAATSLPPYWHIDYDGTDANPNAVVLWLDVVAATWEWDGGDADQGTWATAANWVDDGLPVNGGGLVFPAGSARPVSTNDALSSVYNLTLGGGSTLRGNGLALGGRVQSAGVNTLALPLTFNSTKIIDTTSGTLSLASAVGGAGGLSKTGAGTLEVGSGGGYQGSTIISNGTVRLTALTPPGTLPVSGAALWLRADGITGLADGAPVATWTDESGQVHDATQGTPANQPIYKTGVQNGLPVVRFDGTDDRLAYDGTILVNTDYTVFVVEGRTSNKSNNYILRGSASTANQNLHVGYRSDTGFTHAQYANDYTMTVPGYTLQQLNVMALDLDTTGGTGKHTWRNGTLLGSLANNVMLGAYVNSGIGGYGAGYFFQGDVAEVIMYSRALTTQERQQVEAYLMSKWLPALPAASALRVAQPGTLDLNDRDQQVAGLDDVNGAGGVVVNNGSATATLVVNNAGASAFTGSLADGPAGVLSLTKAGAGTLTLAGTSTYSGTTTINAGTLKLTHLSALGSSQLTMATGTTLQLRQDTDATFVTPAFKWGGNVTFDVGAATVGPIDKVLTLPGAQITGSGTISILNSTVDGYSLALGAIDAVNTGSTFNSTASLSIASISASGVNRNNTYTFTGSGAITVGSIRKDATDNVLVTKSGAGTLTLTGASTYGGTTTISDGVLTVSGAGTLGNGVYGGAIVDNASFVYSSSEPQTLSGYISGSGTLTQNGPGTLTLAPTLPNAYAGGTAVNAGTLVLAFSDDGANQGTLTGVITVAPGATVQATVAKALGYANAASGNVTGVVLDGGLLTLDAAVSGGLGGGQTITMTGGEIRSNAGVSSPTATGYYRFVNAGADRTITTLASTATALITGRVQVDDDGLFDVADGTATPDLLVSAAITGSAGIRKSGAGTLVLSGDNTFTGPTTISAGTLDLAGANVLKTSNAIVVGGGVLNAGAFENHLGTLTVADGATSTLKLAPGGTLSFAESRSMTWNGHLNIEGPLTPTSLQFGANQNGLTGAQLAMISVNGNPVEISDSGYLITAAQGSIFSVR